MSYVQFTYLPGDCFYFANGEAYIVLHIDRDYERTLTTIDECCRIRQFRSSVFEVHMQYSMKNYSTPMAFLRVQDDITIASDKL